uniref:hypothetical protein n=1 Tax=uncultured Proteiniphilum sp. TaxID=497637 RepID=UPI00262F4A5A
AYVLDKYLNCYCSGQFGMGRRSDTGVSQKTCQNQDMFYGFRGIKLEDGAIDHHQDYLIYFSTSFFKTVIVFFRSECDPSVQYPGKETIQQSIP